MKATEYIKSMIDNLVEVYPSIQCSYEVDTLDNSHTLEILPSIFFDSNDDFKNTENDIYIDFFRLYPYEALYFISSSSLLPIQNPIYVKSGIEYVDFSKITTAASNIYYNIFSEKINIFSNNNINLDFANIRDNSSRISILTPSSLVQMAGEGNYALAA
jgi:hypothetical protein